MKIIRNKVIQYGPEVSCTSVSTLEKTETVTQPHEVVEVSEKAFDRACELSLQAMKKPRAHEALVELLRHHN
ncbi:hypothetical protein [Pseudomonas sp.]|uniref:hypothetical protein n=1 Tax=Pseudomonas sp. TaxID=306 RepID=UPI0028AD33A3|nr:hypothetical protein [Pseudomonas sp.]